MLHKIRAPAKITMYREMKCNQYVFETKVSRSILQCGQRCNMKICNSFLYNDQGNLIDFKYFS